MHFIERMESENSATILQAYFSKRNKLEKKSFLCELVWFSHAGENFHKISQSNHGFTWCVCGVWCINHM